MTVKIKEYDRALKQLTETEYPETQALLKIYGAGQLTALTYVLLWEAKNVSNEVAMWVAISACGQNVVSPESETLSSVSPRLATSTSSAGGGVCQSRPRAAWKGLNPATVGPEPGITRRQAIPKSRDRRRGAKTCRAAASHLGQAATIHSVLCKGRLSQESCSAVATTRVPMTACFVGPGKAGRKLAASTSPTEPQTAQSHYGSRKVRIETRRRTTCVATKTKNRKKTQ